MCPRCFDHGVMTKGPELITCDCPAGQARQRMVMAAKLASLKNELGKLATCTFDNFHDRDDLAPIEWHGLRVSADDQAQSLGYAARDAQSYAERPEGWLYLCGPYGSGKSHLAAAVASHLADQGKSVAYASVPDLLDFIRAGYESGNAHERIDTLKRVDVLVCDDLGAESATDWTEEKLFIIINARYLAELPTIFTSNVRIAAIGGRIGRRIAEQSTELLVIASPYTRARYVDRASV